MIAPVFGLCALLIGSLILWRLPNRWGAVIYALLVLTLGGTAITALGFPAPLWTRRLPDEVTIAGYQLVEGKAIYLLIAGDPPQLVQLPWSEKEASQLYDADQKAKGEHAPLKAKLGHGGRKGDNGAQDKEPQMFWPAPREPLPDKQGE